MKNIIKEKLDKIDELYPKERLEKSKARIKAVWDGEIPEDRYPFTLHPINFNYYDDIHTAEQRLMATLDEVILRAQFDDDFIPAVFPGCRQSTIPSMFGAKTIVCGKDYVSERIISDAEDVDNVPYPCISDGTDAKDFIDMQTYVCEQTDGRMPVHVTDMQGPADVCGQLMGYDKLFLMAYTDEDRYRKIMDMATDAFIMFWDAQKNISKDKFIGTHLFGWNYIPEGIGATVSADSIVMVSPDFFDEFYKPYLDRIGEKFGGMVLHSCGDFSHLMENLYKLKNIKGINAGQMTVRQLKDAGLDNRLVAIASSTVSKAKDMFSLIKDEGLRIDLTVTGAWPGEDYYPLPMSEWTEKDFDEAKRANDYLLEISAVR